ncbi:MAG: hypothetical protein IJ088_05775 [Clostridia bacterium]|nr:hypothetical protein [Clostridia bacterium]
MKCDLTCPVEVVRVQISVETEDNGAEQVVCAIDFHSLESEKTVDSVQMNIVCFSADGMRLGGRLVRARARDISGTEFFGTFRPEHVRGTARVEASVEKVWFTDGVVWRRDERNVREYQPNQLPEGRELDRLRSAAGEDAAGYAREEARLWLCVCGRANLNGEDRCRRCGRERQMVLTSFSKEVIEATLGEKERELEAISKENIIRSTEQNVREMEKVQQTRKKRKKRLSRLIVFLIIVLVGVSVWRWGVPFAADRIAADRLANGKPSDARKIYEWLLRYWPDEYDAGNKIKAATQAMIDRLISMNTEDTLITAGEEAERIGDEKRKLEAGLALAGKYMDSGRRAEAETLLRSFGNNESAQGMLRDLLYREATEAKEQLRFDEAIFLFEELGDYMDSPQQRTDAIYLKARALMRENQLEAAQEQFLQVADYLDSMALLRRCRYQLAGARRSAGELISAAELYESLGIYEDSEQLGRRCRYDAGMAAVSQGRLEEAAEQLKKAGQVEDAHDRFEEVVFTLGNAALQAGQYQAACDWFEQLTMTDEVRKVYDQAVYALAQEKEKSGDRESALLLYASLGSYEDALTHLLDIEYDLAKESMAAGNYEEALDRFEGLGTLRDSAEQAENCRREIAEAAFAAMDYEKAISYYAQMKDRKSAEAQIVRCRYAMAEKKAEDSAFAEAAELYKECGDYLDSAEKALQMQYRQAEQLSAAGEYEKAAALFRSLGGYLDARQCTERNEDLWLGNAYRNARLDLETGNYVSVIETLDPYVDADLPERYRDIPAMVEEACLGRAEELQAMGRPLEALPYYERIPNNRTAKKRLTDYVYRVIGRWKSRSGMELTFRRDGTCTLDGRNAYYGGSGYELFIGDEPYPTRRGYQVINLRGDTLTLRDIDADKTFRVTYVGEPLPAEETGDAPEAEPEATKTPTPGEAAKEGTVLTEGTEG